MTPLAVVKLGGSAHASPELRSWLAAIAELAGSIVLVPGGGPFADAVRAAQRTMGFDDRAAHVMAMLAMEQYAHALASLCPVLTPAESRGAIDQVMADGKVPVWCPVEMALEDATLPCSWDVTSDTLALWLARRLAVPRVILIKQASLPRAAGAGELAAVGIVDAALPAMLDEAGAEVWLATRGGEALLAGVVAGKGRETASMTRVATPELRATG